MTIPLACTCLPRKNEAGYYEIRLESIGGLGANLAGKMLAEAGILEQGFNGSAFSSYGSEKKGSPVKAFIRFCDPDADVRINSPIVEPHLLVIFHENLIKIPSTLDGISGKTCLIINTKRSPEDIHETIERDVKIIAVVDALRIAIEEKVKLNTVMLGAVVRISGFLSKEALVETIRKTFSKKYPKLVDPNIRAFCRGYDEVELREYETDESSPSAICLKIGPKLGYLNAPQGGLIINPGNSRLKDLSASREGFIPVLDKTKCLNCGECDMTCPDYCFIWERGITKTGKQAQVLVGINYQYCKGCMRCVEICKAGALSLQREAQEVDQAVTAG